MHIYFHAPHALPIALVECLAKTEEIWRLSVKAFHGGIACFDKTGCLVSEREGLPLLVGRLVETEGCPCLPLLSLGTRPLTPAVPEVRPPATI